MPDLRPPKCAEMPKVRTRISREAGGSESCRAGFKIGSEKNRRSNGIQSRGAVHWEVEIESVASPERHRERLAGLHCGWNAAPNQFVQRLAGASHGRQI